MVDSIPHGQGVPMADPSIVGSIRKGMQVRSSEGKRLGKLIEVYHGESQVYLRVVSAYERWKPWGRVGGGLYFPASAIAQVHGKRVILNMDTKTAKGCTGRPGWIAANTRNYGPFIDYGGGGSG